MRTLVNKAKLGIVAMAMLGVAACDKNPPETTDEEEESGTVVPTTPTEVSYKNIVGVYIISKVEGSADGQRSDITTSWFKDYAGDCAKDDITNFKPDSSFLVQDGPFVCEESSEDNGTWRVISKTKLKIDADTTTIEELTGTTLRIVSPVYSSAGRKIIFTYTRK